MTLEAVRTPLGVGALALVAAGCSAPRDPSLEREGVELVWGGERRLEASDAAEFDQLGYSVSLAADRALLGAYGDDSYRGAAYVFVRSSSSNWTEEQKLVASSETEGDAVGWSVSLSADRALLGAYGDDSYHGAAYVFVRSGGSFIEEQKLVASDGAEGDNFGWSVSLSTDRALVGAYGKDTSRGAAYVFVRSGGSWIEEQKLVASDGVTEDKLGYAVSLDGDRALLGASGKDTSRGAAYVFVRSGGSWTEEQKLVASDGALDDHFGVSVSLAGDRALLGAYWDDSLRGAAYVFARDGSSWTEQQKLVASDGASGHRFGNSVSLGADRALIGAYANDSGRGAAYVFVRSDGSWSEEQRLVASDGVSSDAFGWSVSLAADRALVGAHYDDNLRGAAYFFSLQRANGDPCSTDEDCASGPCEDGICCNRACATSERCRADLKVSGEDGMCGPAKAGMLGAPCTFHEQCTSGNCADGVCCDRTCDGSCEACSAVLKGEGEDGTCECVSASDANAPNDDSGCGCRTSGSRRHAPGSWLGVALGLLLVRRRPVSFVPVR
jgi:hypothetical protein